MNHIACSDHAMAAGEKLVPPRFDAMTLMGSATRYRLGSSFTQKPTISCGRRFPPWYRPRLCVCVVLATIQVCNHIHAQVHPHWCHVNFAFRVYVQGH